MSKEPVLIHVSQEEKIRVQTKYEDTMEALQSVLDKYNAITLKDSEGEPLSIAPLTKEEFPTLFADPESVLFEKLTGGNPIVISGIELDAKKALEIIKKPAGYVDFLEALKHLQHLSTEPNNNILVGCNNSSTVQCYFTIDGNGSTVELAQKALDEIEKAGKHYARTDKAIAMYEFTKEAIELFKSKGLDKSFGVIGSADAIITVLKNSIDTIKWNDDSWKPNYNYLGGNP